MSKEDLISLADRTLEERQEIARKGGIASGVAKREKKIMSEALAKYFGEKDLTAHFDKIMERNDAVTLGLIKEAREALEGSKLSLEHSLQDDMIEIFIQNLKSQ